MTRPRAADDFLMICARMEELRRERARPRAADDFSTIRARVDEHTQALVEARGRSVIQPRPCHRAASTRPNLKDGISARA